jgi:hypothetical protein
MRQFELEADTGGAAPAKHEITVLVTGFGVSLFDFLSFEYALELQTMTR